MLWGRFTHATHLCCHHCQIHLGPLLIHVDHLLAGKRQEFSWSSSNLTIALNHKHAVYIVLLWSQLLRFHQL